jgi:hypothetical protein
MRYSLDESERSRFAQAQVRRTLRRSVTPWQS